MTAKKSKFAKKTESLKYISEMAAGFTARYNGTEHRMRDMRRFVQTEFIREYRVLAQRVYCESKWAAFDRTEAFVLLVAGNGDRNNPDFRLGGVFSTPALAEQEARRLGIRANDIVRSWDAVEGNAPTIALRDREDRERMIPMGKAVVVTVEVPAMVYAAAARLVGMVDGTLSDGGWRIIDEVLFGEERRLLPEVWVRLEFAIRKPNPCLSAKDRTGIPTITPFVVAYDPEAIDPKLLPFRRDLVDRAVEDGKGGFVKVVTDAPTA
jgi:hypothetical protein